MPYPPDPGHHAPSRTRHTTPTRPRSGATRLSIRIFPLLDSTSASSDRSRLGFVAEPLPTQPEVLT